MHIGRTERVKHAVQLFDDTMDFLLVFIVFITFGIESGAVRLLIHFSTDCVLHIGRVFIEFWFEFVVIQLVMGCLEERNYSIFLLFTQPEFVNAFQEQFFAKHIKHQCNSITVYIKRPHGNPYGPF